MNVRQENYEMKMQVLEQFVLMQKTICDLPDEKSILDYVCHALLNVPGISEVIHSDHPPVLADATIARIPLVVGISSKQELQIRVSDQAAFALYETYVRNFCSMVAVIIEGHHKRHLSESHQNQLENRIQDLIKQFRTENTERRLAEKSLRQSERKFRLFVETAQEGICAQDQHFMITYVNDKMAEILGYQVTEMMDRPFTDFLFAEDISDHDAKINHRICGKSEHYERRLRHKDGTERWLYVSATPYKDVNDQFEGSIALFTDITERKRNDYELEKASILMRNILKSTNDLIFVKDRQLRLILCNDAYAKVLGKECPELYGKTDIENGFHPMDVRGNNADGIKGFEQDELEVLRGEIVHRQNDRAIIDRILHIYDTMKFPLKDDSGAVAGVLSISRDITERKRAEEELRHNRNMLAYIVESIPQAVYWKDRNSVYLGCNKVFAQAAGISKPEDIIGKTDFDLPWSQEEAETYRAHDLEVLESKEPRRHIIEVFHISDGTRYWVDTTIIPLTDVQNHIYGILGVYENIADRRRKPRNS